MYKEAHLYVKSYKYTLIIFFSDQKRIGALKQIKQIFMFYLIKKVLISIIKISLKYVCSSSN